MAPTTIPARHGIATPLLAGQTIKRHAEVETVLFSFPQQELRRCSERVVDTLRTLHRENVRVYQLYAASDAGGAFDMSMAEFTNFVNDCRFG